MGKLSYCKKKTKTGIGKDDKPFEIIVGRFEYVDRIEIMLEKLLDGGSTGRKALLCSVLCYLKNRL